MESEMKDRLQLLPPTEVGLRVEKLHALMQKEDTDALLITDNATLFWITGRVFCGWVMVCASLATPLYFVRRPSQLKGENLTPVRKVEEIAPALIAMMPDVPVRRMAVEFDTTSYAAMLRLQKAFPGVEFVNGSAMVRKARAVKTPYEQQQMRISGTRQSEVYRLIPRLYQDGMTDVELQIEIERLLRLHGCLGQFRVNGSDMEIYMGNVLTGDNADTPSPYDFAMGGAGVHPSLPVGADGTIIKPGKPVMVDVNGNFTGYMTDMTRCFAVGEVTEAALKANRLSIDICREVADAARPGVEAKILYEIGADMAKDAGMADYFMGHRYHAGFVGHGVGIEINESPVLAPRSRDIIEDGNAFACEPKFVIPGVGAVGVENTYLVGDNGPAECITTAPEEIVNLR